MKPRVLIFSTAYLPYIGGAEIAVKEITDRLYDFDFDLITARLDRKLPQSERIGNVQVHRVGRGIPWLDKLTLAFFGHRLGKKLHELRPVQGVWAIMASHGGLAAAQFSAISKMPLLLTLQEGDPLNSIERKMFWYPGQFGAIFKQAKILQAISNYLLDWGKARGFKGKTAALVPNGVDLKRFGRHYPSEQVAEVRSRLDVPTEARLVITSSRLVVKNGVEHLVQAMQYLPPEVHLVIAGTGPLENSLKRLAAPYGGRVHFVGLINHQLLPLFLKASEVFVRPSLSEGLGNSFLEAMAAGVTTIGTPVGGIPDFLKDGETGFLTEAGNPTHIANTIKKALALDTHARHAIHEAARELIKKQYSWEVIAEKMKALMIELCASY